jgi:invasion protein IalB
MFKLTKPLLLSLLLASASTAIAQETTTEEAPASEETGEVPGGDLSLGTPLEQAEASAEPRVGEPYIGAVFDDWAMRCLKAAEDAADQCQLYQLLLDADGNAVAELSMFPLRDGGQAAAGATIVAPLETLLTQQLTLQVDDGQARRYPFTFCNAAGCVSRVGFTSEEIALFKRGNAATIRMVPAAAPDQEVILSVSLTGFTAAYNNLDEIGE